MYPGGPQTDGGLLAPGDPIPENAGPGGRRPEWLKVRIGAGSTYANTKHVLRDEALNTVCEEARCPNIGECWALGTATFMILGERLHAPLQLLRDRHRSPADRRLGRAASRRRGRADDGTPACRRSRWSPRRLARRRRRDRRGDHPPDPRSRTRAQHRGADLRPQRRPDDIRTVVESQPEVLAHNVETVPRLQRPVRRRAKWDRSVVGPDPGPAVATEIGYDDMVTKTGIMLGLGEAGTRSLDAMRLLRDADVESLTIGQYLRPSRQHLPLAQVLHAGRVHGAAPHRPRDGVQARAVRTPVRSSYHAAEQVPGRETAAAV